jgi:hypothetical protein
VNSILSSYPLLYRLGAIGVAAMITMNAVYYFMGPGLLYLLLWVTTIFSLCWATWSKNKDWYITKQALTLKKIIPIVGLLALFSPLYLIGVYSTPYPINTDEFSIMITGKAAVNNAGWNILGPSPYAGLPTLSFAIFGWFAEAIGGINLENFRRVHAFFGVLTILSAYLLFSQYFGKKLGVYLAILLGTSHILFAISRTAMRDNTSLFLLLLSFAFGLFGYRHRSLFYSSLGGVAAGLTFYGYYPGRISVIIWILSMVTFIALNLRRKLKSDNIKLVISFLGLFSVTSLPIIISTHFSPVADKAIAYPLSQIMIFKEAQEHQQKWFGIENLSVKGAYMKNLWKGLSVYNIPQRDEGFIYFSHGLAPTGVIAPLAGVFLWIGVIFLLLRPRKDLMTIISLIGFLTLYLGSSFLLTKNPSYTRLFVILPFVTMLVGYGIFKSTTLLSNLLPIRGRKGTRDLMQILILLNIVYWNAKTFLNANATDFEEYMPPVTETARYIYDRTREGKKGPYFFLATSLDHYYSPANDGNEATMYNMLDAVGLIEGNPSSEHHLTKKRVTFAGPNEEIFCMPEPLPNEFDKVKTTYILSPLISEKEGKENLIEGTLELIIKQENLNNQSQTNHKKEPDFGCLCHRMTKCPNIPEMAVHSPKNFIDEHETKRYLNSLGEKIEIICKVSPTPYPPKGFIYYTTDGTMPSGSYGIGGPQTKVIELTPIAQEHPSKNGDNEYLWYRAEIPQPNPNSNLKYMVGFFQEDLLPETGSFIVFTSHDLWIQHKERIKKRFEEKGYTIKEVNIKRGGSKLALEFFKKESQ